MMKTGLLLLVSAAALGLSGQMENPDAIRLTYVTNAYPCLSPDGKIIAFQSNQSGKYEIYTVTVDSVRRARIVSSAGDDITPAFSPDGTKIAFVSERTGNRQIYLCSPDGSHQMRITTSPGNDIHPSWSADGKRIMFSSNRGNTDPDNFDIYQMNADGSGVKQITSGPDIDTYASWSPDGKKLVTRRIVDGNSEVFVMNADGSDPKNVTNSPNFDGWPSWSPDGKKIVFASGPVADPAGKEADMRIWMMNSDGSGKVAISSPPNGSNWVYDTQPSFSKDGKLIVFARYRPGVNESADICKVRLAADGK